jgi:hypothetical protein
MNAGRLLLGAWQANRAALEQLTAVHRGLQVDLEMNEQCLDESGALWKEKDRVLQELRGARKDHKQAKEDEVVFGTLLSDETKRKQIRSRHPVSVIETEEQSRDTHCGYSIETRCVST